MQAFPGSQFDNFPKNLSRVIKKKKKQEEEEGDAR